MTINRGRADEPLETIACVPHRSGVTVGFCARRSRIPHESRIRKKRAKSLGYRRRPRGGKADHRSGDVGRHALHAKPDRSNEIVLGTRKELDEHAALMQRFPNMEHDEPYMSHVKPAKTGEIVWNFNRVGDFEFACLVPGHYQAGMVGKIKVVRAKPAKDKP
jgi:hypothetical protein